MNLNSPFVILESSWLTPAAVFGPILRPVTPFVDPPEHRAGVAGFLCYLGLASCRHYRLQGNI